MYNLYGKQHIEFRVLINLEEISSIEIPCRIHFAMIISLVSKPFSFLRISEINDFFARFLLNC